MKSPILLGVACIIAIVCIAHTVPLSIGNDSKAEFEHRLILSDNEPLTIETTHYSIATGALAKGHYSRAEAEFRAAIGHFSPYPEYGLAETLTRENKLDEAITCYLKIQSPDSQHGYGTFWRIGTLKLARLLWIRQRTSEALLEYGYYRNNVLGNALEQGPPYPYDGPPFLCDFSAAKPTDAIFLSAVDTAIGVEEDSRGYYSFNGPDDAVGSLQSAVAEAPDSALCHYYLAKSLHIVGRVDEAKLEMDKALLKGDSSVKWYAVKKLANW